MSRLSTRRKDSIMHCAAPGHVVNSLPSPLFGRRPRSAAEPAGISPGTWLGAPAGIVAAAAGHDVPDLEPPAVDADPR